MPSFNKVILIGHITRDVTAKTIGESSLAEFGIAVNEKYKTKSGEQRENVLFIDCAAWGRTGEVIAQYFGKGKPILVEGKLKMDVWEDKNGGGKRSKISLTVDSFAFVGGNKESDGDDDRQPDAQPERAPIRPNVSGQKLRPANRPGRGPDGPVVTRQEALVGEPMFDEDSIPFN